MGQKGSGCISLLLGSIVGGVISLIFSSYITRDLGDLPSIAVNQFILSLYSAVSGGAIFCLINNFMTLKTWSARRIVVIVALAFLVVPSIYYSYLFVHGTSDTRLRLVNIYTFNEIRNSRHDLLEFVHKNGKEALKPEVLKTLLKVKPEKFALYKGLEIEQIDAGNSYILRMHHKKGNQEFALSRDTYEIYWRYSNEKDWKKVTDNDFLK